MTRLTGPTSAAVGSTELAAGSGVTASRTAIKILTPGKGSFRRDRRPRVPLEIRMGARADEPFHPSYTTPIPSRARSNQSPPQQPQQQDTIPIDAETRWRDHHLKRQWAQSVLIESLEPPMSRHLRYSIKSVLHFTSLGPEMMDLKAVAQGGVAGNLGAFMNMTPTAAPTRPTFSMLKSTAPSMPGLVSTTHIPPVGATTSATLPGSNSGSGVIKSASGEHVLHPHQKDTFANTGRSDLRNNMWEDLQSGTHARPSVLRAGSTVASPTSTGGMLIKLTSPSNSSSAVATPLEPALPILDAFTTRSNLNLVGGRLNDSGRGLRVHTASSSSELPSPVNETEMAGSVPMSESKPSRGRGRSMSASFSSSPIVVRGFNSSMSPGSASAYPSRLASTAEDEAEVESIGDLRERSFVNGKSKAVESQSRQQESGFSGIRGGVVNEPSSSKIVSSLEPSSQPKYTVHPSSAPHVQDPKAPKTLLLNSETSMTPEEKELPQTPQQEQQSQPPSPTLSQSRSSRIWGQVRRAVNFRGHAGGGKGGTIYQVTAIGSKGPGRFSLSDTHLPSPSFSSASKTTSAMVMATSAASSTTAPKLYRQGMPSLSSSVLSLLKEDRDMEVIGPSQSALGTNTPVQDTTSSVMMGLNNQQEQLPASIPIASDSQIHGDGPDKSPVLSPPSTFTGIAAHLSRATATGATDRTPIGNEDEASLGTADNALGSHKIHTLTAFETPPETAPSSPVQATHFSTSPSASSLVTASLATNLTAYRSNGSSHSNRNSTCSNSSAHSIPDLAKRSSIKSPVVVAKVTTTEFKVGQFMYTGKGAQSRPLSSLSLSSFSSSTSASSSKHTRAVDGKIDEEGRSQAVDIVNSSQRNSLLSLSEETKEMTIQELGFRSDYFSTPNAQERNNLQAALLAVVSTSAPTTTSAPSLLPLPLEPLEGIDDVSEGQFVGSVSSSRVEPLQQPKQTRPRGYSYWGLFSSSKEHLPNNQQSLDAGHVKGPSTASLKAIAGEAEVQSPLKVSQPNNDPSLTLPVSATVSATTTHPTAATDALLALSPTKMVRSASSGGGSSSGTNYSLAGMMNDPSKQDRRRSALSFGGYFSGSSATASETNTKRESMSLQDHSDVAGGHLTTGQSTGLADGEVIHMRRTSLYEKSSFTAIAATTATASGSNASTTTGLELHSLLARSSGTNGVETEKSRKGETDSAEVCKREDSSLGASVTVRGGKTGMDRLQAAKRMVTPLKITPLLLSGVTSAPSPSVLFHHPHLQHLHQQHQQNPSTPQSATMPLPMAMPRSLFATLDRHFFITDQVHEWNIPTYGRVRLTDHAPVAFQVIRELFNYTLSDMDEALSQPMTVMKTPGKSDAIFFASHNHGRFLLKTLRGSEPTHLLAFLTEYMAHVQKYPNTLLPRYLGMYTFEKLAGAKLMNHDGSDRDAALSGIGGIIGAGPGATTNTSTAQHLHLNGTLLSGRDDGIPSKITVVVLANVFDTPNLVHERYDFKGSTVGRRTLSATTPAAASATSGAGAGGVNGAVPQTPLTAGLRPRESLFDFAKPRKSTELEPSIQEFPRRSENELRMGVGVGSGQNSQGSWYRPSSLWSFSLPDQVHQAQANFPLPSASATTSTSTSTSTTQQPQDASQDIDISHLTLKEMDFQNRILTGETQLIHIGAERRAELLAQLEEDTALLRRNDIMIGIRIVPKVVAKPSSHFDLESIPSWSGPSSPRLSRSSRGGGSDADNSDYSDYDDTDEDDDGDKLSDISSLSGLSSHFEMQTRRDQRRRKRRLASSRSNSTLSSIRDEELHHQRQHKPILEALEKFWTMSMMNLSDALSPERLVHLKHVIREKAQDTLRDIYYFGEDIVSPLASSTTAAGITVAAARRRKNSLSSGRKEPRQRRRTSQPYGGGANLELDSQRERSLSEDIAILNKCADDDDEHNDASTQKHWRGLQRGLGKRGSKSGSVEHRTGSGLHKSSSSSSKMVMLAEAEAGEEGIDLDTFQTVRYKPRGNSRSGTDGLPATSLPIKSLRPRTLTGASTGGSAKAPVNNWGLEDEKNDLHPHPQSTLQGQRQSLFQNLQQSDLPQKQDPHSTPLPSSHGLPSLEQQSWSQGVESEGLQGEFEAIYYFGLIDILQKYTFTKRIERGIKGALLSTGIGGGGGTPMTPTTSSGSFFSSHGASGNSHPGRAASMSFYQLLPYATASEPALPLSPSTGLASSSMSQDKDGHQFLSASPPSNATPLSVLLEDPTASSTEMATVSHGQVRRRNSRQRSSSDAVAVSSLASGTLGTAVRTEGLSTTGESTELGQGSLGSNPSTGPLDNHQPASGVSSIQPQSHRQHLLHRYQPNTSTASTSSSAGPRLSGTSAFSRSASGSRFSHISQTSSNSGSGHGHSSGSGSHVSSHLGQHSQGPSQGHHQVPSHHSTHGQHVSRGPSTHSNTGLREREASNSSVIGTSSGATTASSGTAASSNRQSAASMPSEFSGSSVLQQQQQQLQSHTYLSQMPQHAEVSVEEPGRYAERLV
ncbi:Phosphatidylinositol 5-phosphate 4-kinase type-2 alpha, partial [Lunasporangiospora selenospora]